MVGKTREGKEIVKTFNNAIEKYIESGLWSLAYLFALVTGIVEILSSFSVSGDNTLPLFNIVFTMVSVYTSIFGLTLIAVSLFMFLGTRKIKKREAFLFLNMSPIFIWFIMKVLLALN